ncbi:hypothetical protein E2C01_062857 [Portunus trituberculatus]|uniref:Uncharacterized protein n=1 Tax=Portunus trituberculatus TaxID=210409 RepID=A0A5B7HGL3_PORTR|nr:hypothetical protein [Portunus trituberculatus]
MNNSAMSSTSTSTNASCQGCYTSHMLHAPYTPIPSPLLYPHSLPRPRAMTTSLPLMETLTTTTIII